MHLPRNRTRWDKYMLKDISNYNGRSELVRLRGKYTVQTAHCALVVLAQWPKATEVVYEQGMLKARPSDPLGKSCLSINARNILTLPFTEVKRYNFFMFWDFSNEENMSTCIGKILDLKIA